MDAPLSPSGRPGRRGGRQRSPDGFPGPYGTGEGGPKQTLLRILTFLPRAEALSPWPMPVDCRPVHVGTAHHFGFAGVVVPFGRRAREAQSWQLLGVTSTRSKE